MQSLSIPGILVIALAGTSPAHAGAPDASLGVRGETSINGSGGTVELRGRLDSGVQLGLQLQAERVGRHYIDGWPARGGVSGRVLATTAIPLVVRDRIQLDFVAEGGVRGLSVQDTRAVQDTALFVQADVGVMATLPLRPGVAARLGWMQLTHLQVDPSVGIDATGAELRSSLVMAASQDIQLTGHLGVGGVLGFGGDGRKHVARAGLGLRWVPGAARTYTNH